jgi:MYXO-CTERM domain-containing protein
MVAAPPSAFGDEFIFGVPGLLLVGLLLLVVWRRRRWPPEAVLLMTTAAGFTLFWFWTGQQMRYLSTLLPLVALLFVWALASLGTSRRTAILLTLVLGFFAAKGALETSQAFRFGFPPPVRYADREILLATVFPCYRAVRALNQVAPPSARTYLLFSEESRFHIRGVSYGDWFGEHSYSWLARDVHSLDEMLAKLRGSGFEYMLVAHARATEQDALSQNWFAISGFVRPYTPIPGTELVYADDKFAVFRLVQ